MVFGMLVISHTKTFTLWVQITDIYYACGAAPYPEYNTDPFILFSMHHPHALRFLVMWPLIEFTYLTGLSFSETFPWFILLVFFITSWVLARVLSLLQLSRRGFGTELDQPLIFASLLLVISADEWSYGDGVAWH